MLFADDFIKPLLPEIPRANASFPDRRNPFEANSLEESGLLLDSSEGNIFKLGMIHLVNDFLKDCTLSSDDGSVFNV